MRIATRALHALSVFQPTWSLSAALFAALLISSLALAPAAQAQTPLAQVEDSGGTIQFEVNDQFSFFPSRLGIGTSSPATPLHVLGSRGAFRVHPTFSPFEGTVLLGAWEGNDGNAPQVRYLGAGTSFFDLGMDADGNFTVEMGDTPRLTLLPGGNLGIGTTAPGARLDVNGSIRATGFTLPTGATDGYVLTTDADGNASWQAPTGGSDPDDGDWTIDGDNLTSSRSFSAPSGTFTGAGFDSVTIASTGSDTPDLVFKSDAAREWRIDQFGAEPTLRFSTTDGGGTFATRVRFFDNGNVSIAGNVGIGTTSPTDRLQVGDFSQPDQYLSVKTAGGNQYRSGIKLRHFSEGYGWTIESDERTSTNGLNILSHLDDPAGISRLFVQQSSGNVGIGTTTPSSRLSVAGVIESTTGGIKFPDGSIQTTAGGSGDDGDWTIDGSFLTTFNRGLTVSGNVGQVRASIGRGATASGDNTFATGLNTTASGAYSTALNRATNAIGPSSIAMGNGTTASANNSLALGFETNAEGNESVAMGIQTRAGGLASTAMGRGTVANASNSLVIGKYNRSSGSIANSSVFAIGGGTSSSSRDIFNVLNDGRVVTYGRVTNRERVDGFEGMYVQAGPISNRLNEFGTNLALSVRRDVSGSAGSPENHAAVIANQTSGGDVLALSSGSWLPDEGTNYITFFGGNVNGGGQANRSIGRIEGTGDDVFGNGIRGVSLRSGGADFAEMLPRLDASEVIDAGKIVGVTGGKITQRTAGAERLMVVSDRAIIVGNMPQGDEALYEDVAFIGQVPTWVEGHVNVGDWIVASGRGDGIGRAVAPDAWDSAADGPIVGQAWEAQAGGTGRVNTAIGLDHTKPLIDRLTRQQEQLDQQARLLQQMEQRLQQLEANASH